MRLASFSIENYRAFSRRQDIEIRPLTLFFGRNSGGKSALVRFLPLLGESIRVAALPIWLAGDVGRRATWSELVCKSTGHGILRFALRWEGTQPLTAEWEIRGSGGLQEVKSLSMTAGTLRSKFDTPEGEWPSPTFVPCPRDVADDGTEAARIVLSDAAHDLSAQVQWISGVRVPPPRIALSNGGASHFIQHDGSNAVDHLVKIQLWATENCLLEKTQRFFHALGERLSLDNPIEGGWRLLLSPLSSPKVSVNLCDVGEGYAQVLPILVALARACSGGPRFLCLEQPELHLHTRAQVELAKLLVETVQDPAKPSILLETHSEVLLISVQLAIAEGKINPDMVRVYWVEACADGTSDAIPVDFDEHGRPVGMGLVGAFGEVVQLAQQLITRQLAGKNA